MMAPSRLGAPGPSTDLAPVFAALGDGHRLRIVATLCDSGPQSITRLTAGSKVSRQAITKHLAALEHAGLVDSSRAGRERLWRIKADRLRQARLHLEQISSQWDRALERLRALVEPEQP